MKSSKNKDLSDHQWVGGEFPVRLYAGQRFLHVVFAKLTSEVERPYQGRYQGQRG